MTSSYPSTPAGPLLVMRVRGPDAGSFLNAQLTRDVPPDGQASLAGYCSPKGRLLAMFVVWTEPDGTVLLVARDIAEAVAKRLRMYVLRAKVTIDIDAESVVERHLDADVQSCAVWSTRRDGTSTWIRYPDADGRTRLARIGPPAAPFDEDVAREWHRLDIRAGLPQIVAATQDRFVPQMVNLEALGGVDFKKGCFPGQEVVARSQYLGKLKRRTALASASTGSADRQPKPGDDVWQRSGNDPVGLVVDVEHGADHGLALLVELPVAAFGSDDLTVGAPDGPALRVEALPYALPDNEVFVRPKL